MTRKLFPAVLLATLAPALVGAQIVSSKHNLSVSGPGPVKSMVETEVCVFCHISHKSGKHGSNRPASEASYQPYRSSTLRAAAPGAPTGASRMCLSCHDGTIAVGQTLAAGHIPVVTGGADGRLARADRSNIGTDLRKTHPVSFVPSPGPTLRPLGSSGPIRMDSSGQLQCTSCHDPHKEDTDSVRGMFLVMENRFSALCTSCHALEYWSANPASHAVSTAVLSPQRRSPKDYLTVAENGCGACHLSHGASERGRLLRGDATTDDTCLACHNGSVASLDVAGDVRKSESHGQRDLDARHDAAEGPGSESNPLPERVLSAPRHAACVDCHNPHAAVRRPAMAPNVPGALLGVWGIDADGRRVDPARYEYEVCFKCHADSVNLPQPQGNLRRLAPRRAAADFNLRRAFAADAISFHPVQQPGRSGNVPGLLPPYSPGSLVYCSDCHASDTGKGANGVGPRGPHGSSYPFLLERNLSVTDRTFETPGAYALCYKCHSRDVLLSAGSRFPSHARHVRDEQTPCTACHASHGVSSLKGNPTNNAHLIDFDTSIVSPNRKGLLEYQSDGHHGGTCSLSCHGANHHQQGY